MKKFKPSINWVYTGILIGIIDMDLSDRGARLERVTACALHGRGCVFGMDIGFHWYASVTFGEAGKYILTDAQKTS